MHTDHGEKPINTRIGTDFPTDFTKVLFKDWGPLKAYIVSGKEVREGIDLDYTEGGNYGKYSYIPEQEIWLDDRQGADELLDTLYHELIEYPLIGAKKMSYDDAHEIASRKELEARKTPEKIEDLIDKQAKYVINVLELRDKTSSIKNDLKRIKDSRRISNDREMDTESEEENGEEGNSGKF